MKNEQKEVHVTKKSSKKRYLAIFFPFHSLNFNDIQLGKRRVITNTKQKQRRSRSKQKKARKSLNPTTIPPEKNSMNRHRTRHHRVRLTHRRVHTPTPLRRLHTAIPIRVQNHLLIVTAVVSPIRPKRTGRQNIPIRRKKRNQ